MLLLIFYYSAAHAQEEVNVHPLKNQRMHQLGGKRYYYGEAREIFSLAFMYTLQQNLLSFKKSSLSAGTHFSAGFSGTPSFRNHYFPFILDIPLVAEYNKGFGSARDRDNGLGYYVGFGYSFQHVYLPYRYGGSSWYSGPVMTGGFRFPFSGVAPLDLGISYMPKASGLSGSRNIFGISLSYMFNVSGNYR